MPEDAKKAAEAAAAAAAAGAKTPEAVAAEEKTAREAAEKDRDAAKEDAVKARAEAAAATFEKDYALVQGKYPAAKDLSRADIEAAVKKGLSVEDATVLALNKAGKLAPPAAASAHAGMGGSAATTIPMNGGERKNPKDMNREELRASMVEAVREGEIALSH